MHVGTFALEQLVAPHRQEDVEIARRTTPRPSLTLAGEANTCAVLDARRNIDLQGLVATHSPLTGAAAARLVDYLAGAVAGMAGALDGEEALLGAQPTAAMTGGTLLRFGARFRTAAVAS